MWKTNANASCATKRAVTPDVQRRGNESASAAPHLHYAFTYKEHAYYTNIKIQDSRFACCIVFITSLHIILYVYMHVL